MVYPVDFCLGIVIPESEAVQRALIWRYRLFSSLEGGCPWRVSRVRLEMICWDWENKSSFSICGKQRNELSLRLILDPRVQNVCHFILETFFEHPEKYYFPLQISAEVTAIFSLFVICL